MKNFFYTLTCLFFLTFSDSWADWTLTDKKGEQVHFNWIEQSDLQEEERVFIDAFMKAYQNFSLEQLGIVDKLAFLKGAFEDVREEFINGTTLLLSATINGKVIGFVGFKETEKEHEIYISQLAIDPAYWQHGVGKELVFSIFKIKAETRHLVAIPRRINEVARQFYMHLGFSISDYMHPGYDPNKYVGYEWSK